MSQIEPSDFTACPHWGKGGRYVAGADGKRVPVSPEGAAAESRPAGGESGESAAPLSTSSKKGK